MADNGTTFESLAEEPEQCSKDALFGWALKNYGYQEEDVRRLMKSSGHTRFKSENWYLYTKLIQLDYQDLQARTRFPKDCPICHKGVKRDYTLDGRFGVTYGWVCEEGGQSHFFQERTSQLRENQRAHMAQAQS